MPKAFTNPFVGSTGRYSDADGFSWSFGQPIRIIRRDCRPFWVLSLMESPPCQGLHVYEWWSIIRTLAAA